MCCPCCGGSGQVTGLGYGDWCPECYGSGAVDTVRRWFRAWRHLAGRSLAMLFLSAAAGLSFGIPAVLAVGFVLWLCGASAEPHVGALYRGLAGLIALGVFASFWFDDGGPARLGRGMLGKWTKTPIITAVISPFVIAEAYSGDLRKPIRQVVAYFITSVVFTVVMGVQSAIAIFILVAIPVVWFLYGADHLMDEFLLTPLRMVAYASGFAAFVFIWCDKRGPPRPGRGLFNARHSKPPQTILDYIEKTECFVVKVSPANHPKVQQLTSHQGFHLSIPASTPETACLFTRDHRAAAYLGQHATARARVQLDAQSVTGASSALAAPADNLRFVPLSKAVDLSV